MKKILIKGIVAGLVLLIFSYVSLQVLIAFFPELAVQYYDPVFSLEGDKTILFFIHPFIVSFALAWFWSRFKSLFHGSFVWRGIELGLSYALVAVLPSMWITFSAFSVSIQMVATWLLYGLVQGIIVGIIYAKISPE